MDFSIKFSYVGHNLQIDILSQKIDFVLQTLQALVKCRISSGSLLCLGGGGGEGGVACGEVNVRLARIIHSDQHNFCFDDSICRYYARSKLVSVAEHIGSVIPSLEIKNLTYL